MYLRHGTFSYLPPLTDDEIALQVKYALDKGWPVSIEYTDDPHPRNVYWELWGLPMFDLTEADGVLTAINDCRATFPHHYIRVLAYDATLGRQTTAMQFVVNRPAEEPGFALNRIEGSDRTQRYSVSAYSGSRPAGQRYAGAET